MEKPKRKGLKDLVSSVKNASTAKKMQYLIIAIVVFLIAVILLSLSLEKTPPGVLTQAAAPNAEEAKVAAALEKLSGVGDADVVISRDGEEIAGVIVIAQGVDDIGVKLKVMRAVKTLLAVAPERIDVFEMKAR